jgi:RNA polymerase sigma-70 factor (ECF subfamily)
MSAVLGKAAVRPSEPAELTSHLYEKHGQRVFTFCYSRLRNREEAQDAAQTTFIYVMRSLQRGVEPEFELAWLLKIAFNVCRGVRRSTGRNSAVIQDVEDIDTLAAPQAAGYEGSERVTALRDALASLPERQRRGILLREWQGLSYAEIADELGLSLGAVETLLFRARRNLASRLEHVRGAVGALNVASLASFFRPLLRSGFGKLGLIGASASVALIPVVASEITPAFAHRKPVVTLRAAAPADAVTRTQPATNLATSGAPAPADVRPVVTGFKPRRNGDSQAPAPDAEALVSGSDATSPQPVSDKPPTTSPAPTLPLPSTPSPNAVGVSVPVPQLPVARPHADTAPLEQLLSDPLAGVQGVLP